MTSRVQLYADARYSIGPTPALVRAKIEYQEHEDGIHEVGLSVTCLIREASSGGMGTYLANKRWLAEAQVQHSAEELEVSSEEMKRLMGDSVSFAGDPVEAARLFASQWVGQSEWLEVPEGRYVDPYAE